MFAAITPTPKQAKRAEVCRVGLMTAMPFYAHLLYSEMQEVFTKDIPTAATDGRRVFINPDYLMERTIQEGVFIYAHEIEHFVCRHPQRIAHYGKEDALRTLPWDAQHFNFSADYVINAGLIEAGVGMMNPDWLYAGDVAGDHLTEDVYEKKWKDRKRQGSTHGNNGVGKGGGDPRAKGQGGSFDQLLPPEVNPVTGKADVPSEMEFKEAVARAAAAAKAVGKLPAGLARRIEDILEPQVDWREHVRMLMTGRIGSRSETWDRPNRRRLVLNPMVVVPGRRGFGAELVAVAVDTSGSIGQRELDAFFTEIGSILTDVRPRRILILACDAKVHDVTEVASIDEMADVKLGGGGGTRFEPVFEWFDENNLQPETLVYLTDMLGSFPAEAPAYPTIWCSTSQGKDAPFGDVIEIKV